MIQFNLLPDVKQAYIKARRTKRTVMAAAGGATALALAVLLLLFVAVNVLQKRHLNNLNKDIKKYSAELKATPDLNKILTIQNQLNSLPGLHDKKLVASRLFTFIGQLTPAQATIAELKLDLVANTISINGSANDLGTVNKFADTLKFTDYKAGTSPAAKAFSKVVLANFTRDDKKTQYELTASFDPVIFNSANDVTLTVPNIISTRSATEKPTAIFEPNTNEATP